MAGLLVLLERRRISRRIVATATVFVLAACSGTAMFVHRRRGRPPELVAPPLVNLGEVRRGIKATASFEIKNAGSRPLTIEKFGAQCGCTLVQIKRQTLQAGETELVSLSLDTSGFWREVTKNVYFVTNDPSHRLTVIPVEAYVRMGIRLVGSEVQLGSARGGVTLRGQLEIVKDTFDTPDCVRFDGLGDEITAHGSSWARIQDADHQMVDFYVNTARLQCGSYSRRIGISLGEELVGQIQLNYAVLPRMEASPAAVTMDASTGATGDGQDVRLTWNGQSPLLSRVQSIYGHCACDVVERTDTHWTLRVRRLKGSSDGVGFDVIVVSYIPPSTGKSETVSLPVAFAEGR